MNSKSDFSSITHLLSEWYKSNKRDLPWRRTNDPYQIWISEIILQQTRVEQGMPYFESIKSRFPNVSDLAESPLDELLKLWQGLGYYSRARNMHTAAKQIMDDFNGVFPTNYDDLLQLKGIGEYTASAISSIAFKHPKAVVDGNVFRVLSRLFSIDTPINTTEGKKLFTGLAELILDNNHPDIHNQAMMDFGAMQCTPVNPDCLSCPLSNLCLAFSLGKVQVLPVKQAGAKKQIRYFHYLFLTDGRSTWLQQRTQKDIWQQLWEFPLIESDREETIESLLKRDDVSQWAGTQSTFETPVYFKHILSHRIIHARFFTIHMNQKGTIPENWKEVKLRDVNEYAFSRLMDLFMEKHSLINL